MAVITPDAKKKHPGLSNIMLFAALSLLLVLPGVINKIHVGEPPASIIKTMAFCALFLLIPLVLFYRNIKVYLYILTIFAVCVPMVCFSIYFFGLYDMSIITSLIMQTNIHEAMELTRGLGIAFILVTLVYTAL